MKQVVRNLRLSTIAKEILKVVIGKKTLRITLISSQCQVWHFFWTENSRTMRALCIVNKPIKVVHYSKCFIRFIWFVKLYSIFRIFFNDKCHLHIKLLLKSLSALFSYWQQGIKIAVQNQGIIAKKSFFIFSTRTCWERHRTSRPVRQHPQRDVWRHRIRQSRSRRTILPRQHGHHERPNFPKFRCKMYPGMNLSKKIFHLNFHWNVALMKSTLYHWHCWNAILAFIESNWPL